MESIKIFIKTNNTNEEINNHFLIKYLKKILMFDIEKWREKDFFIYVFNEEDLFLLLDYDFNYFYYKNILFIKNILLMKNKYGRNNNNNTFQFKKHKKK